MIIRSFLSRIFIAPPKAPARRGMLTFNLLLSFLLLGIAVYAGIRSLGYDLRWEGVWRYRISLIRGFQTTLLLSLASLVLSLVIGILFGLAQRSSLLPLRIFSRIYIEIVRGSPLLVQILIFFYVIANSLGIQNRYAAGVIIMSIFSGAYIAEIIRGGVESIGDSQRETARAVGLTRWQTYRFVILPQVLTRILPPLAGQFASLVKDSSLLSIIAVKEFTLAAREINAATFSTLESYLPLALGYLALTLPLSFLTRTLEKKYAYDT